MVFQSLPGKAGYMLAACALLACCISAQAEEAPCPLAGQKPMLVVQLFFGQSIKDRGPLTKQEWNSFLRDTVTPRFPDGLTVYDAYGQWQDREIHRVTRENSKVILIAAENTPQVRDSLAEVSDIYRKRFHQQSVAVMSTMTCVAF